jgi:chromosomal replication initiator protein
MQHGLWQSVLGEIELSVSTANFQTWFKDTELLDSSDDEVVIAVKNIFAKKQFEARFNEQVAKVLEKNGITPKKITYEIKTVGKKTRVNRVQASQRSTCEGFELGQQVSAAHSDRGRGILLFHLRLLLQKQLHYLLAQIEAARQGCSQS